MLFIDELEMTFRRICETSPAGVAWPTQRRPNLRRILMPRSENHLYFEVDESATIYVVAGLGCSTRNNTEALKTHRVPIGTLSETM